MLKQPLSYKDQVDRLKSHGMIIDDEKSVCEELSRINYYRFTGYALQYRKAANNSDYIPGTTYDQVIALYHFDEELRDCLRKYIECVEVYFRTIISHEFSMIKCSHPPYDQHYDEQNYYNKIGFEEIKEHFEREKSYYKDSLVMKHHQRKYDGKMPLWVMVEMMSISDVSKLYSCMYYSEQAVIAKAAGTGIQTLKNHLHCIAILRNKCSHAARLYNTTLYPAVELSESFLRKYPSVNNDTLFAYMVALVKRLPKKEKKQQLIEELDQLLTKYNNRIVLAEIGFPVEWKSILLRQHT